MSCSSDPAANLEKVLDRIADAAKQGAQIVCLQELFRSQYFCQEENAELFNLAEPIPGPSSHALDKAAKQHGVVIVGSLFERRAAGVYHNTATVHDADGSMLGMYRKMHIPDDPLYYEKYYFTPGDLGFKVFETRFGRIGTLVCWDQWYPEAARLTALRGADLLVYPTAIGWHPGEKDEWGERQREAWRTIQRSHAVANNVYVAAVNRVGVELPLTESPDRPLSYHGIEFWGDSFVAGPMGEVIARAGSDEQILLAECDFAKIETIRRNWPFLRDRRIDAYTGIDRRFLDA
ncbi:MAG: carbon-nitrogen hydrolase [Acidobacteria bacterium]|nr:carbon-nitrogen hydrolase [Acidobacteriota bacterium]